MAIRAERVGEEGGFVSLHRRYPPPLIPVLTFFFVCKRAKEKALVIAEKGKVVFKKTVGLLSSKNLSLPVTLVII